ncbi:uncharacterized protein LOC106011493 [Aplysia californica]|uniref:Uncharacterized protein LOC106011493 n=1 Tax=Aplysia californica TaxID=6500 RepID=A0ABM0ZY45_APLCA|nr:uncharacterized protein LOC106011493 [Aplysia californica]
MNSSSFVSFILIRGSVSREQYIYLDNIFGMVKAVGEPTAAVCLALSAIVFLLDRKRNATTLYLVALNFAESFNMTMLSVYQLCKITPGCNQRPAYHYANFWLGSYVGISCRRSVQVLNCLVATQRFIAIAFPLRAKTSFLLNHPTLTSLCVLLVSLSFHSYMAFMYDVGPSGARLSGLAIRNYPLFRDLQHSIMYLFMHLSLVLTAAANIGTTVTLVLHKRKMRGVRNTQKTSGAREKNERSMTIMVLVCTALFVVMYLPVSTNQTVADFVSDYGMGTREHYLFFLMNSAFMMCQVLAAQFVFVCYLTLNSSFRKNLVIILFTIFCPLPKCRLCVLASITNKKNGPKRPDIPKNR